MGERVLAKTVYECLFLLDSNRYARDPGGVSGGLVDLIEKCGGEILASRLWFEQKLAYPVNGHRKGTYWLTIFRLESTELTNFNRQCRLNETILRQLALKVEPRLVNVLVEHAQGGSNPRPRPELEAVGSAPRRESDVPEIDE